MKTLTWLTVALCTTLGGAAVAQEGGASRGTASKGALELGFRTGYALALGSMYSDMPMNQFVVGQLPFELDMGYRINPNWYAGLAFNFGIGFTNSDPAGGCAQIKCSATDLRVGLEAQYHPMPGLKLEPWVGFGLGYESLNISASAYGIGFSTSVTGFTFTNVSVGGDVHLDRNWSFGPYLGTAVGLYTSDVGGGTGKSVHLWLTFGARGTFDLYPT